MVRCQATEIDFWGINFGANTRGACIRTRANTGKYSWQIIYVLVSCQGVIRYCDGNSLLRWQFGFCFSGIMAANRHGYRSSKALRFSVRQRF